MPRFFRTAARKLLGRLFLTTPCHDEAWRDKLYERRSLRGRPGTMSLDIGSGPSPRNPFQCEVARGVDLRPGPDVVQADLTAGTLPFSDASFDAMTAYDLLEHIPRVLGTSTEGVRFPLVELMNEVHRCLRPDGVFFSSTPCYPWPMAFQDPTHVNVMTEDTLRYYFCGPEPWAHMYGFRGCFTFLEAAWVGGHHNAVLTKQA